MYIPILTSMADLNMMDSAFFKEFSDSQFIKEVILKNKRELTDLQFNDPT